MTEPVQSEAVKPSDATDAARVLLVDDDVSILSVLSLLLRRGGFAVDVAHNAQAARTQARAGQYDAALVDVRLRDGCGTELADELQRDYGLNGRVALMTGGNEPGALPCLLKPFRSGELLQLIAQLAAQSSPGGIATLGESAVVA